MTDRSAPDIKNQPISGDATAFSVPLVVRRKIPLFTNIIAGILACCVLLFFIAYLFMIPARLASLEMKSVYYLLGVPTTVKGTGILLLLSIVVLSWLYYTLRLRIDGMLYLLPNEIIINIKGTKEIIPARRIKQIQANNPTDSLRRPKEILQLIIHTKSGRRYSMRLKNYEDADSLMNAIMIYQEAPIACGDVIDFETDEENNEYIKRM